MFTLFLGEFFGRHFHPVYVRFHPPFLATLGWMKLTWFLGINQFLGGFHASQFIHHWVEN
jgi:hypothetical protein